MRLRLALLCATLALASCAANGPPPRYHTLLAPPAAAAPAPATAARPWQLLPVLVPAQVDRPQWVVRTGDNSLAVLEQERWIAPLPDEIAAALTDAFSRRLGPPSLAPEAWRVRVDVQRLESVPGRLARLDVVWALQAPGATVVALSCGRAIEQPVAGGYAALAAAHRAALEQLGQEIAAALATLASGRTSGCAGALTPGP
jgi:uncharacterized lipoprotein YmbA